MRVSEMMTVDVATVTEEASLNKAFQILHDRRHKVLPVVRGNNLVGLLSEKLLAEVRPSKATSLSVYEINYLMSRTKVRDVMIKDVHFINPGALVEEAALMLYNHDIGSLPVVEGNDKKVVGIVTQKDIFKAFIGLMGVDHKGTRLSVNGNNDVGNLAKASRVIAEAGVNISHVGNYNRGADKHNIVLRVDTSDTSDLQEQLRKEGFVISSAQVFE